MPPRRTKPAPIEAQQSKDLAEAQARGRTHGLREALVLLGVGLGFGLATALAPTRPGKCTRRSPLLGPCRLDAGHEGDCQHERLFGP